MNLKRRSQRTAPFTQQNWLNGVNSLQNQAMGVALSTPRRHQAYSVDDSTPPQKRRRLSSPDSLDVDHLIASPHASENRNTLRIEVFKIFHRESKKVRSYQNSVVPRDVLNTKGNCRITIYDTSTNWHRVLHCQNQLCDITTYKNPVGPHRVARIDMPRPFFVPEESMLVNRLDEDSHDISESYKLVVELEAADSGPWPPLEPHDFGIPVGDQGPLSDTSKRYWVMSSEISEVQGRIKNPLRLTSAYNPQKPSRQTDYIMDVDLRWTSGFRALKRIEKGSMPCITAIDPDAENYPEGRFEPNLDNEPNDIANGGNVHVGDDPIHEVEDNLVEGDQTPSRSLRVREKTKVYNLKVLSDQAQGKERKRRARAGQATAAEGRVTYYLPIDQPVNLDYYRCISCGVINQSMAHLQLHLQTVHSDYEYVLETTSQGPQFRVSFCPEPVSSPSKTFHLAQAIKPFNLETFVAGDQSWATSRLGPDTSGEPLQSPARSSASRQLFGPSPEGSVKSAPQGAEQVKKRKKVFIPETGQPVFDPVSKARLKPGDEVPSPVKDNEWLIHKHRENIAEFSDVTAAEKEYVCKWDAFILQQNLTSSAYFPRAWIAFLRKHVSWLAGSKHRMLEFGKHSSYLLARDMLSDEMMNEAFNMINEERAKIKRQVRPQINGVNCEQTPGPTPSQSPRASQIRKNKNGCAVCHLPVLGPRLLLCSNKKACPHRLYHSHCIKENAITPVTQPGWRCNSCSEPKETS